MSENHLKVGDTLPSEGAFAERLGVSCAVVREGFSTLAALHQIDVGNGRKARVAAIDGSVLSTSLDHAVATAQVTVNEHAFRHLDRRFVCALFGSDLGASRPTIRSRAQ